MSKLATSPLSADGPSRPAGLRFPSLERRGLALVSRAWWIIALAGQTIFTGYVAALYGTASLRGDFERWNAVMPRGWVRGDTGSNLVVAAHLALATLVFASGALQLSARVRRAAPRVHRWNGRFYLLAAATLAATGVLLVVSGRAPGDDSQHAGTLLNAALILVFATCAYRDAVARRFAGHARWALRLLLAVAGVWFFRIGLMAWIVLNRGPAGFDPDAFRGPTLTALAFAQTLLPLALLEAVFRTRRSDRAVTHWVMAGALVLASLLTLLGVVAATLLMWLPAVRA